MKIFYSQCLTLFFCLLLFLLGQKSQAQTEVEGYMRRTPLDSGYIKSYADQLILRGLGLRKSNRLNLLNGRGARQLSFRPNENFNVGFGFNYQFIGLNLAFDLPFINNDDDKYGHTNIFDLELNVFAPSFGGRAYYQRYQGFYIDKSNIISRELNGTNEYILRPDLRTFHAGFDFYYVFNYKKFSQRASFVQNERQKRSAGSWLLGSYLNLFSAKADSSFLPKPLQTLVEKDQQTQKVAVLNTGVSGGYVHTFVFKKYFYVTLSAEVGLGLQNRINRFEEKILTEAWGFGNKFKSRIGLGYNGEKYFGGITSLMDNVRFSNERHAWLESSMMQFRVFWGYRIGFDARKTIKMISKKQKT